MLIKLALVCVVFGNTCAAPVLDESQAVILQSDNHQDEHGNYNYWFETSNGIKRYEQGVVQNLGLPDQFILVTGQYSYTDPEGKLVVVKYRADDNGFHILPPGEEIIPPGIGGPPPAVVASLLG